jgi:hypothetical protein
VFAEAGCMNNVCSKNWWGLEIAAAIHLLDALAPQLLRNAPHFTCNFEAQPLFIYAHAWFKGIHSG